jgi:type I restriction enzyme M protein
MSLSTTIKSIQDIMRKDVGVDGDAQRIGQLVWLLFLKIWDDREQELRADGGRLRSPLVERDLAGRRASAQAPTCAGAPGRPTGPAEGAPATSCWRLRERHALPGAQGPGGGAAVTGDDPHQGGASSRAAAAHPQVVFEDAYQYMKSGTLLRQVLNKLQAEHRLQRQKSRHLFGDIYEQILRDLQGAGNAGEYYTPRAVTQFAVDMVNPRLGEVCSTRPAAPAASWPAPSSTCASAR